MGPGPPLICLSMASSAAPVTGWARGGTATCLEGLGGPTNAYPACWAGPPPGRMKWTWYELAHRVLPRARINARTLGIARRARAYTKNAGHSGYDTAVNGCGTTGYMGNSHSISGFALRTRPFKRFKRSLWATLFFEQALVRLNRVFLGAVLPSARCFVR